MNTAPINVEFDGTGSTLLNQLYAFAVLLLFFGLALQSVPMPGGVTGFQITTLVAALIIMLASIIKRGKIYVNSSLTASLFMVFLCLIFFATLYRDAAAVLLTVTFTLAPVLLVLLLRPGHSRAMITAGFSCGVVVALSALGQYFSILPVFSFSKVSSFGGGIEFGYTGLIPTRGSYGIVLAMGVGSTLILQSQTTSRIRSAILTFIVAMFGVAALVSLSRSTILSYVMILLVYGLVRIMFSTSPLRLRGKRINLSAPVLLGTLLGLTILWQIGVLSALATAVVEVREASVEKRIDTILRAAEYLSTSFFFGVGSGIVDALGGAIHNAYVAILVERGIFVFLAFLFLNFAILIRLLWCMNACSLGYRPVFCALLAMYAGVQTELMFFRGYMSNPYWLFVAFSILITEGFLTHNRRGLAFGRFAQ